MNYYLATATGTDTFEGGICPAVDVIASRMKNKVWPLYSGTPHRSKIEVGDAFIFYAAGYHASAKVFCASAVVSEIKPATQQIDEPNLITDIPHTVLILSDIAVFEPKLSVRPLIPLLSIFKGNEKNWGTSLQGGVKVLTKHDYEICLDSILQK